MFELSIIFGLGVILLCDSGKFGAAKGALPIDRVEWPLSYLLVPTAVLLALTFTGLAPGLDLLLLTSPIWLFVRLRRGASFSSYGIRRAAPRTLILGGAAFLLMWPLTLVLAGLAIHLGNYLGLESVPVVPAGGSVNGSKVIYRVVLAYTVFVGPVVEEVYFRGFLYTGLRSRLSPILAALVAAGMFGLAHPDHRVLGTFLIGLLLVLLYEKTGNLLVPTLGHVFINLVAVINAAK